MDLSRTTVGDLFDQVAFRFPENEALIDVPGGGKYSYRELLAVVNQMAKGFLKVGLKEGEHLALWAPNRAEWIITQLALAKIGVLLISVDTNYQVEQLEYLLKQSDSRSLVATEGLKGSEYLDMIHQLCPAIEDSTPGQVNCPGLPELKNVILISEEIPHRPWGGILNWKTILDLGRDVPDRLLTERQRACHDEDVVTILYTSGTTGAPKGVMSTHYGIVNTTLASADNQRLTEADRLCLSVPLSHMFGCICITLAAIMKGAAIVIPSRAYDPLNVLKTIDKERCTALYGSPSLFIALMEHPEFRRFDLRTLRTGIMGGAQCPMELMKKVVEEMGVTEIVIGYGQTEASSWITQTRPEDPLELRVSTVGRPLPNIEVKMIDPGTGQGVPNGTVGEICAKGFNMKGYYKMPAATANALDHEGWLHTGDLGMVDKNGYVRTTGRLKEVINKGGETIYPIEIEEVLFKHPKISNVSVFGVPSKKMGEEVAIWIKLEEGMSATEEEILQYCQGKLPDSYLPRYIKFVKEFPMTPLGKVQKFKIKEMAIEEYGLG